MKKYDSIIDTITNTNNKQQQKSFEKDFHATKATVMNDINTGPGH